MSQATRRFLLDSVTFTLARGIVSLRGLIVLPLFAATLGAASYGTFTQVLVLVNFARPVVTWKLETAIVRFLVGEKDRGAQRAQFYAGVAFLLASTGVVSLAFMLFAKPLSFLVFGATGFDHLTQPLAAVLLATVLGGYTRQFYRIDDRVKTLSALEVAEAVLETGAIAAALLTTRTVESTLWAVAFARGTGATLQLAHAATVFGVPSALPRRGDLWPMLVFGLPLMPDALLNWAVDYADRIVIAQFLDLERVGMYAASYSVAMLLNLGLAPISFVFYPAVLRSWKAGERDRVTAQFTLVTRYSLLLSIPAAVGMALVAPPVLMLAAGKAFVADPWIVLNIALGIAMNAVYSTAVYIFHLAERTTYLIRFLLAGAALNLVLNLVLVPLIGLQGAAFATLATYLLLTVWVARAGRQWVPFEIAWLDLGKAALAAVAMGAVVSLVPRDTWLGVLLSVPAGVACYGGFLLLLRAMTLDELRTIGDALRGTR